MSDNLYIDGQKLHFHPQRVAALLDAGNDIEKLMKIYPIYMEISPVGACNHRCTFCAVDYIGYKAANKLDFPLMEKLLPELASRGVKSIMYAGEGEPLLHKHMGSIAQKTKQAGIDVSFTTNAVPMTDKFIEQALPCTSWIKVSLNAGTASSYAEVHQTREKDFQRVIDNLKRAVEFRNQYNLDCTIGIQSLLLPENKNDMITLAKIARDEIGADYFVIKPYSQEPGSITQKYKDINYDDEYLKLENSLIKMETDSFAISFRSETMRLYHESSERRYTRCYSTPVFLAYIMASGDVYGCKDHLFDKQFCYGNINAQSFTDIWQGEDRENNLNYVLNELDVSKCRVNCRMDKVNRYLFDLREDQVKHVNFI